ncbi:MAG: glycerol-3-phosphate acyltransferase [Chloroflexota bacterium]|nr:glycerol-3-phosphate acyltransferase [Chloroflexota bacterium]
MTKFILPLLGYLCGSLPFALWITRWVKGIDVRDGGSGHVTTTNTIRQAGWVWGIMVLVLDIGKGFLPVYAAARVGLPNWAIALTAGLAVAGHCWPIFAQFRGGMGLAVTCGSYLAVSPLGVAIAFGVLLLLVLIIHHAARGSFFAALAIPLALWPLGQRGLILWVAIATGAVIAVRFLDDWKRDYNELWLDRDN